MNDLIQQLEQASAGSRELGDLVLRACGWRIEKHTVRECGLKEVDWWVCPEGAGAGSYEIGKQPNPTTSLDAALTLLPEGWRLYSLSDQRHFQTDVGWFCGLDEIRGGKIANANNAATPALAMCIAALKAIQAEKE